MLASDLDSWSFLVEKICKRFSSLTGNLLGERQKPMVEARLRRYLTQIQVSIDDYPQYWKENEARENEALIALLTTHFTAFFREFLHFEWLADYLPKLIHQIRLQGRNDLCIWSAACSRGQEVWSLAMWLDYHMKQLAPDMRWSVHGTDIDLESIKIARNGVYHRRELETAPRHLWEHLWQQGKEEIYDWYRVKKSLRDRCSFANENLLDLKKNDRYDVIFCRNVLIYFNSSNQLKAINALVNRLSPAGALVTGVSESLAGFGFNFRTLAPSVYSLQEPPQLNLKPHSMQASLPRPLKVLCVDDSNTVLSILKKILHSPEFEVVGVANNGQEALEKIDLLKPDVLTLDLHMPIMDGFSFVKNTTIAQRLPIVVVSTVERQNGSLVHPLFEAGVCDFLEKPTLDNLSEVGAELQQKLKMSYLAKKRGLAMNSPVRDYQKSKRTDARIVINAGFSDRDSIQSFLKAGSWANGEIYIHLHGESFIWERWASRLKTDFPEYSIKISRDPDWTQDTKPTIVLAFCGCDIKTIKYASAHNGMIFLEDGVWTSEVKQLALDSFPATSFAYMAEKILEGK
jgi:chemotaxis protein methyltransferase CheR